MIFDRTQSDVDAAIRLRNEKVKIFQELTEEDVEILERGTLTTNTINRIEQKQDDLKNLFNGMGYFNTNIQNKSWDFDEIFYGYDFERIVNNTNILKNAFFVYSGTPQTPSPSYDYKTFNDLEKILYDLDVMINDVKSHYRECGTFECGGN
jgi:hypothetical protein